MLLLSSDLGLRRVLLLGFFALPNQGLPERMIPLEFQTAINYRLLMPYFAPESACEQRSCAAVMEIYGSYKRLHAVVTCFPVDAHFDRMVKARFFPVKDAPVTCLGLQ